MRTKILHEDKNILVVYKPAGLATQTGAVEQADVVSELKNYLKNPYLGIVHRLDQPVEGLLVFGKTKEAASVLARQLSGGAVNTHTFNKHYYAVICGEPEEKEGELTDYLYKNADNRAVVVPKEQAEEVQAKQAVLRYRVQQTLSCEDTGAELSLADIFIKTGRFHQIRAQMAHAGMPLLGDSKYGTESSRKLSDALQVRNVALCAYKLQFRHPISKKSMDFQIEPQGAVFQKFTKNNREDKRT